jgi:hypothetical protein
VDGDKNTAYRVSVRVTVSQRYVRYSTTRALEFDPFSVGALHARSPGSSQ